VTVEVVDSPVEVDTTVVGVDVAVVGDVVEVTAVALPLAVLKSQPQSFMRSATSLSFRFDIPFTFTHAAH